jgi:uncharacterized protein YkuJ
VANKVESLVVANENHQTSMEEGVEVVANKYFEKTLVMVVTQMEDTSHYLGHNKES